MVTVNGTVGKYDATTGRAINPTLIDKKLPNTFGIAVEGNSLFVTDSVTPNGGVGKYDSATGAVISPSLITDLHFAFALALSGNALFVAEDTPFTRPPRVGKYDATTGEVINATFIKGRSGDLFLAMAVKSAK